MIRNRIAALSLVVAVALGAVSSVGCSFGEVYLTDPFLRQASLEEIQKHYSSLVRWSAFNKAAKYVDPEARDAFLEKAPDMKHFRFSDYESGPVDVDDETGMATVKVTYFGYSTRNPFEVEIVETQVWKRASIANDWQVTPEFDGLDSKGNVTAKR
jgi:hypothetical protein